MRRLDDIRRAVLRYEPSTVPEAEQAPRQAAVALIVHPGASEGPEILFIERAHREGDPWSGDMAFPGGRREIHDSDLEATASRETHEEVGVVLPSAVGQLDDFQGSRNRTIPKFLLRPYVYVVPERPATLHNHEVQSTVWIPLRTIYDPRSWTRLVRGQADDEEHFPAFEYQGYTVWGLTFRVLRNFGGLMGLELPDSAP